MRGLIQTNNNKTLCLKIKIYCNNTHFGNMIQSLSLSKRKPKFFFKVGSPTVNLKEIILEINSKVVLSQVNWKQNCDILK